MISRIGSVLLMVVVLGCSQEKPRIVVDVPPLIDYTPILAWTVHSGSKPTPAPVPVVDVQVGDTCPTCGGDGELGDGRTIMKCTDCGGDGKVNLGDKILNKTSATTVPVQRSVLKYTYFINYKGIEYVWTGSSFTAPGKQPISFDDPNERVERMGKIQLCQGTAPCLLVPIQRR